MHWYQKLLKIGVEAIVAALQHFVSKTRHDWLGLQVEVPKHCVALPVADEFDGVGVNITIEQCHGATCSKGASTDVIRTVTVGGAMDCGGSAQ